MISVIQAVEEAILTQLKPSVPTVQVLAFPNDPTELGHPVVGKQIYVGFKSKSMSKPSTGLIGGRVKPQECTLQYELILRMADLRSHQSSYPVLDAIEQSLIGFRPDIGTERHLLTSPLYGIENGFVDFGTGLWVYSMTFGIDAVFTSNTQPSWGKPISK